MVPTPPGKNRSLAFFAFLPILFAACLQEHFGEGNPLDPNRPAASSFEYIQFRIFDQRCIKCHIRGDEFADESGLILTGDVSYNSLINQPAKNEHAAGEGLVLVSPGHPDRSFLYRKLILALEGDTALENGALLYKKPALAMQGDAGLAEKGKGQDNGHLLAHGSFPSRALNSSHGKEFGKAMPMGSNPLPNGHVEFIRQWILAGAPRDGHVANADLLLDTVPGAMPEFVALEPPAPGEGIQIGVEQFPIPPQFEREFFIYLPVGNTEDIFVNRMKIKMRPGSHHFLLYMYDPGNPMAKQFEPEPDVFRELRNIDGTLNIQNMTALTDFAYVVGGTQVPEDEIYLPEGVGIRFPAGTHLDFNSHYVNYSNEVAYGEVAANLYTIPASEVKYEAFPIDMDNTGFKLPPNQTTVVTSDFRVGPYIRKFGKTDSDSMHIGTMFSHTHQLGKLFVVVVKGGAHDGDTLYVNHDWHHPPYRQFDPPVVLGPDDTLTSIVTFENNTDKEVGFGFKSTDEMNIIFGFWY